MSCKWVVNCSNLKELLWSIYGYMVSNVNSKNKISVILLAFCLYHLNSHISLKTITVYFSRIVPNQRTENINIHEYWYLHRNCLDTLPSNGRKWIHKELEKIEEVRFIRLSIVSRPLLINLKGFRATWWKI